MKTCKKCAAIIPPSILIGGKRRNLGNRIYCLDCSPFGGKNTRDLTKKKVKEPPFKVCSKCREKKPLSEYYLRKTRNYHHAQCKSCYQIPIKESQKRIQEYMNSVKVSCTKCGYSRCKGALEFHHLNPADKLFEPSKLKFKTITAVKKELKKCIVVCSNCHRELHDHTMIIV